MYALIVDVIWAILRLLVFSMIERGIQWLGEAGDNLTFFSLLFLIKGVAVLFTAGSKRRWKFITSELVNVRKT